MVAYSSGTASPVVSVACPWDLGSSERRFDRGEVDTCDSGNGSRKGRVNGGRICGKGERLTAPSTAILSGYIFQRVNDKCNSSNKNTYHR